ncbi:MAG: ABC transporter substrate-binding protein [Akkermansia sp.]|nr:ABC transporter substrate-binding protein [Akkermansia sp.]
MKPVYKTLLSLGAAAAVLTGAVHLFPAAQEPAAEAADTAPAPYPADMAARLGRVAGMQLAASPAPAQLPELNWQDAADLPDTGDPAARKGGTVRLCNVGPYPANFLHFGSTAAQFFHYNLFTMLEIHPVERHPATGDSIPGTAAAWSVQGRTVYYRLNPAARYTNGRPLRAADYVLGALLRLECGSTEGAALRAAVERVESLGDTLLAVTLRQERPQAEQLAAQLLHPAEPGFYADFSPGNYRELYAQRIPPTTAAYTVGRTQRGRLVELRRVQDWWAAGLKYYRNRFNPDRIEHHFLVDEAQAWELFLRGGLDMQQTRNPEAWERYRAAAPPAIRFREFTARYPVPPYGIALNSRTIPHAELRRGLMQAMDMDRAVAIAFRGRAERLHTFTTRYARISPQDTPEYRYSPAGARACFAAAGFTAQGQDGILHRADGTRLSVRLAYTPSDKISAIITALVQSAAACGAEIVPEPLPWQDAARRQQEGTHEMVFWATVPAEPVPDYARYFAAGATGYDAPFRLDDPQMERLVAQFAAARTTEEQAALAAQVDRRVQELAIWLPGWQENRVLLAHHPRIRFPDCPQCRFSTPAPYDIAEAHLYWVEDAQGEGGKHP